MASCCGQRCRRRVVQARALAVLRRRYPAYRGRGRRGYTGGRMTFRRDPAYGAEVDWGSVRRVDVVLAVLAGVVQIGGTALVARHHPHVRTLDVYGYLLLAAGPAALLARRKQPVPVLMLAFATTLGYVLLGYPGGPIWMGLIVAFGTALMAGHRIAAYGWLLAGYLGFLWLPVLTAGQPAPSAWAAGGLAAWLLLLLAGAELIRNRRAFAQASRQRAIEEQRSAHETARRQASEERLGIARDLHDVVAHSLSISVDARVAPAALPRGVDAAGYRIVQEALTNVDVRIGPDDGDLVIEVEDDGAERPGPSRGGGSGIRGMTERAEALGGQLTAGREPGRGFAVRARLPLEP